MSRGRNLKKRLGRTGIIECEVLEERRLLTGLVVNDTPGVDVITLGTKDGGIQVVLNGVETDYKPDEWDSVLVATNKGPDTVNVEATIVPTVVHYTANGTAVNVGDAGGVQHIEAPLNMNGVMGGPVLPGTANIFIDDGGDAAARTITMHMEGEQEQIDGLAPARISIGVVIPPLGPAAAGTGVSDENLTLTTGTGADRLTIGALRGGLSTGIFNAEGSDVVKVGAGSLQSINSPISVWGRTMPAAGGTSGVVFDDSSDTLGADFTISAIYPPGPGAIVKMDFSGPGVATQTVSWRVEEVRAATIDGGSGGNTFHVAALPSRTDGGPELTINAGGGDDKTRIDSSGAGTLITINGQGGDDAVRSGPMGPFAPTGMNGDLTFDGGEGNDSLIVLGPESNPLDIPIVPVEVGAGLLQHRNLKIQYADVGRLVLQNGDYQINEDLGPITLAVSSEPSTISFESTTRATINASQNLAGLEIDAPVSIKPGERIRIDTGSFAMGAEGSLDVADGALRVHYGNGPSPFAAIRASIFAQAILTSGAEARHGLGYVDSADGVNPDLPARTVIVTFALKGDANLDRSVGFADLVLTAQHYGLSAGANWDQGDFDLDGAVGFGDLVIVAQNYGQSDEPAAEASPAASSAAALLSAGAPTARAGGSGAGVRPRRRR